MKYRKNFVQIGFLILALILGACSTNSSTDVLPEPEPKGYRTHLSQAISGFGFLLQAYPSRRPFRLDEPVILEIAPIPNFSGEDGLPPDFSTVLTTIISDIGFPIAPKPPISYREREVAYGRQVASGPSPHLTIRGSVTEGEKRMTSEFNFEMDLLFEDRGEDGRPGRDAVDTGGSRGGGNEVRTLALDLHLVDSSGLVVEAVSHRIDVVRRGKSSSYGVFFRGSGIGYRARKTIAHSNSHALRIAAQQGVLVLFGRYFRTPYWRLLPGSSPDQKLVNSYRKALKDGQAPEDFRLLLYAHGVKIAFDSYTFSASERRDVGLLKSRLGLPQEFSDLDLAMHLWQTVPFNDEESRLGALRRSLQGGIDPSRGLSSIADTSLVSLVASLRPGQELFVPVFFDYDLSMLSEPSKKKIDRLVEALITSGRFDDDWWIELRGHSDQRGEPSKIQELSAKRAEQVRFYLQKKHSVPSERIVSAGFGSSELAQKNAQTEKEHSQNRRVEILLVAGKRNPSPQTEDLPAR